MKTKVGISLFLAMMGTAVSAQNPVTGKRTVEMTDTLTMADLMELLDTIPSPDASAMPDTVPGRQIMPSDSMVLKSDSMEQLLRKLENDSIAVDSTAADSLRIRQELPADSLNVSPQPKDTVVIKPAPVKTRISAVNPVVTRFNQELARLHANYFAYFKIWDNIYLPAPPVRPNADYYKLCVPATFYNSIFEEAYGLSFTPETPYTATTGLNVLEKMLPCPDIEQSKKIDRAINKQLLSFYRDYPDLVSKNEDQIKDMKPLGEVTVQKQQENIKEFIRPAHSLDRVVEKDLLVVKPNFWTTVGNGYLQFSQTHISKNWYKGGESSNALASGLVLQTNYDDKQRIQFENKLEWKLSFISTPSDTVHQYRPNTDLLRLSSKFGYKAITNWYYTVSAEFKTQLFSQFEVNTDNIISTFFSPAEFNAGIGMDYKLILDEKLNLSVLMNPLNYTLYSVASDRVDPTKFNIKEGHKHEYFWGSKLEATLKWRIMTAILWESRFTYNTNYKKVLSEWENTFTFSFNRYWSAKLFVHGRFDDGVPRVEDRSYFQLQETLSLGLNYIW